MTFDAMNFCVVISTEDIGIANEKLLTLEKLDLMIQTQYCSMFVNLNLKNLLHDGEWVHPYMMRVCVRWERARYEGILRTSTFVVSLYSCDINTHSKHSILYQTGNGRINHSNPRSCGI